MAKLEVPSFPKTGKKVKKDKTTKRVNKQLKRINKLMDRVEEQIINMHELVNKLRNVQQAVEDKAA